MLLVYQSGNERIFMEYSLIAQYKQKLKLRDKNIDTNDDGLGLIVTAELIIANS